MSNDKSFLKVADEKLDAMKQYAKAWWTRDDAISDVQKFEGRMLLYAGTKAYLDANGGLEKDVAANFARIIMQEGAGLSGMVAGGFVGGVLGGLGGVGIGGFVGGVAGAEWGAHRFETEVKPIIDKYLPRGAELAKKEYLTVLNACAELPNKVWYDRDLSAAERVLELKDIKEDYLRVAKEFNDVDPVLSKAIIDYVKLTIVPRIEHLQPKDAPANTDNNAGKEKRKIVSKPAVITLDEKSEQSVSQYLSGFGLKSKDIDPKSRFIISEAIKQYAELKYEEQLRAEGLNFANDALKIVGVIGQINGNEKLMQVAHVGTLGVDVIKSISALPAAFAMSKIVGTPFAMMQPIGAIILGGLLIVGALKKKKNSNDNAGLQVLMKQLQTISQQLNLLNENMLKHFQHIYRGQEQIYRAVIEGARHLERTIHLELKSIREPLFLQLGSISNRLLLIDQIVTLGIEGIVLQPLQELKDGVEHIHNSQATFQGDNLLELRKNYKGLLAWSRELCKNPNLTGKNGLQVNALKSPHDISFSADIYRVPTDILVGENSNLSIQVGYLMEFAHRVLDINIETSAVQNVENWLMSLKLLLKLQALLAYHEVLNLNTSIFELDSLIKTANDFHHVVRGLQHNSQLLFEKLTARYKKSYSLLLNKMNVLAKQHSALLLLNDPRLTLPCNVFDNVETMAKEMTLKELIALNAKQQHAFEVYLAPSMMKLNYNAPAIDTASDVNARAVIINEHGNFREGLDINKILADFADSPYANDIPKIFLIGSLIGHGELALRINELSRQKVTAYSPLSGFIHDNSPGSASYTISLVYKISDSQDYDELMSATYEVNSPYHYVDRHDVKGNGHQKMLAAISKAQTQVDANFNTLSSASYFHQVWAKATRKDQPQLHQNNLTSKDSLLLSLVQVKVKIMEKVRNDSALQPYLERLNADYQLIIAFAWLIGFNDELFQQLTHGQSFPLAINAGKSSPLLRMVDSVFLDKSIESYNAAVNSANTTINVADPMTLLSTIDITSSMAKIIAGVKIANTSNQFVSPLSIVIEDQLAQLELRRANILTLQSKDELSALKTGVLEQLGAEITKVDDDNVMSKIKETLSENVCGGDNQERCVTADFSSSAHQATELPSPESPSVNKASLAAKQSIVQTSTATRAMPFYFMPLEIFCNTILEIGKSVIGNVDDVSSAMKASEVSFLPLGSSHHSGNGEVTTFNAEAERVGSNELPYTCAPSFLNGMPILYCNGEDYSVYVFPKGSDTTALTISYPSNTHQSSIAQDNYALSSCKPVEFYGKPAVYCEGEQTTFIYQSELTAPPFQNLDGQVMLFAVGAHLVKQAIGWFFGSADKKEEVEQKQLLTTADKNEQLETLKVELESIEKLLQGTGQELLRGELKWIVDGIDGFRYDIEDINDKRKVTVEELQELNTDIRYFHNEAIEELKGIEAAQFHQTGNAENRYSFFASSAVQRKTDYAMLVRNNVSSLQAPPALMQLRGVVRRV